MVRLPEQLLPLQEPEPEREAVLPLAPVAVAEREQLLPLQLPCALNELVPRGPETDELRSQAKALVAMERARTPIRAAVEMMFFIFHLVCVLPAAKIGGRSVATRGELRAKLGWGFSSHMRFVTIGVWFLTICVWAAGALAAWPPIEHICAHERTTNQDPHRR